MRGYCNNLSGTVEVGMLRKTTPETPVAIRAKLTHLRNRKRVLDELIVCLERYAIYEVPGGRCRPWKARSERPDGRLAGAA